MTSEPLKVHFTSDLPLKAEQRNAIGAMLLRTSLLIDISGEESSDIHLHWGSARTKSGRGAHVVIGALNEGDEQLFHTQRLDFFKKWENESSRSLEHWVTPRKSGITLNLDVITLTLNTLGRADETHGKKDQHCRPAPESNPAFEHGLLDVPWLDQLCYRFGDLLLKSLNRARDSQPRWYYCPTLDIDSQGMFQGRGLLRSLREMHRKSKVLFFRGLSKAILCKLRLSRDPHLGTREIAEALEGLKIPATIFVQTHKKHRLDNYTLRFRSQMARELRGIVRNDFHDFGLHSSYATYDSEKSFYVAQVKRLQRVLKKKIHLHRAHYLRHTESGLYPGEDVIDSSLGYGSRSGFRHGTAFPFRQSKSQIQAPPCVMDTTLRYYEKLDSGDDQGYRRVCELMKTVQRTGGLFIPIWHPNNMEDLLWPGWKDLFFDMCYEAINQKARFQSLAACATGMQAVADRISEDLERYSK